MKSNELRVGNWVSTKYKELSIIKITEIRESVIYSDKNGISYSSLLPIPLTEEILLKCGFEKTIVNTVIKAWLKFSFFLTIRDDGELFYEWKGGNIQVKYLHQLQNLYFALTNKELEINL